MSSANIFLKSTLNQFRLFFRSIVDFSGIDVPFGSIFFSPFSESQSSIEFLQGLQTSYQSTINEEPEFNSSGLLVNFGKISQIPCSTAFIDKNHNLSGSASISITGTKFEGFGAVLVGSIFLDNGTIKARVISGDSSSIQLESGSVVLPEYLLDMSRTQNSMSEIKSLRRDLGDEESVFGYEFRKKSFVTIPPISFSGDFRIGAEVRVRNLVNRDRFTIIGSSNGESELFINSANKVFFRSTNFIRQLNFDLPEVGEIFTIAVARTSQNGGTFDFYLNGLRIQVSGSPPLGLITFDRISRSEDEQSSFLGLIKNVEFIDNGLLLRSYSLNQGAGDSVAVDSVSAENGECFDFYAASWIDNWVDKPINNFKRKFSFSASSLSVCQGSSFACLDQNGGISEGIIFQLDGSQNTIKGEYQRSDGSSVASVGFGLDDIQNNEILNLTIEADELFGISLLIERDGKPDEFDSFGFSVDALDTNQEIAGILVTINPQDSPNITIKSNLIGDLSIV
jgi:hypothetical protein